jgi:xylulokinase
MPLKRALLVDGGAKSPLWRRIMADVTGLTMGYIAGAVGAPLGDALLAGIGSKTLKDYKAIREWVKVTDETKPNPRDRETYEKNYAIFKRLYASVRDIFKEF